MKPHSEGGDALSLVPNKVTAALPAPDRRAIGPSETATRTKLTRSPTASVFCCGRHRRWAPDTESPTGALSVQTAEHASSSQLARRSPVTSALQRLYRSRIAALVVAESMKV